MFHILGLDHVVLRVTDVLRMTRFYCDVLGCRVERVREDLGLTQLRAGQSLIDFIAIAGADKTDTTRDSRKQAVSSAQGRNMDHVCLRIEPFDQAALIGHLISHGVVPGETKRRYGADGYGPSIYISDPEGNTIELKGPPAD
jgi:glyoxylase I family protein